MVDYISRPAFIADCEGRYCAPCKEQGKDDNGWNIRESEYYDKTLEDMPFFCSSEESLETIIKKAILNEVLPVIEGTKMITEEGENHDN